MKTKTFPKLLTALLAALLLASWAMPAAAQEAEAANTTTAEAGNPAAAEAQEKTGTLFAHLVDTNGKEIEESRYLGSFPAGSLYSSNEFRFLQEKLTKYTEVSEGGTVKVTKEVYQLDTEKSEPLMAGTVSEGENHIHFVYNLVSSTPASRITVLASIPNLALLDSDSQYVDIGTPYDFSDWVKETRTTKDGKVYRYVGMTPDSSPISGKTKEGVNLVILSYAEVKEGEAGQAGTEKSDQATPPAKDGKASSDKTPASQSAAKQDPAKQDPAKSLPSTGDAGSWILILAGAGLLTIPFIKRSRK